VNETTQTAIVIDLLARIAAAVEQAARTSGTEPYMTVEQAACFLGIEEKTVRNYMHNGTLRPGIHWFRPPGLGPRLKRAALVAWIERDNVNVGMEEGLAFGRDIPRGCRRGQRAS
jgi:excisionase family DNA binding protein